MGLCSKVVSAVGFSGKLFFLESVCFHLDMFDVTKFRLVLAVCNVHVVLFIKKNPCNSYFEIMVKIMPCFFLSEVIKKVVEY